MEKTRVKISAEYEMSTIGAGHFIPKAMITSVEWSNRKWVAKELKVEPTSWMAPGKDEFLLHSQFGAYLLTCDADRAIVLISGCAVDSGKVNFYLDRTFKSEDEAIKHVIHMRVESLLKAGFTQEMFEDMRRDPDKYLKKD